MSSRLNKTFDILIVFFIILIGPRVILTLALWDFLADYMIPWGFSNAVVLAILIWILLFQENTQLKFRLIWTMMAIPTLSITKFIFDHGWIVGTEYVLGKIPFIGEWVQKVALVVDMVAIVPCVGSVLFDIAFVIWAGHISGKIPVTHLKASWYETLTIMGRWLPWNRD